jgi:SAM-dependent methyltransferase
MRGQHEIAELLRPIAAEYPRTPAGYAGAFGDPLGPVFLERTAFDVNLVWQRLKGDRPTVIDIGGGFGLFSVGIAALGGRSIMIDDNAIWRSSEWQPHFPAVARVWERHGVEVIERDVIANGLGDAVEVADAITSFHFVEHVHASPKRLFHDAVTRLSPDGVFAIGAPNCANLRKRVAAVLGRTSWSTISEWYEEPEFRGHVREPSVGDLRYIGRDLGLRDTAIYGRNFLGFASPSPIRRAAARIADRALRLRPTLCSDLYLVARKGAPGSAERR